MNKRALAAGLWFAAAWFGYEILWSVTGAPRPIGPILAAGIAALVVVDPFHRFWAAEPAAPPAVRTAPSLDRLPTA